MIISVVLLVLLYFLIGVLLLLAYILAMKPQSQSVLLGLMVVFWPLILLIDLILSLSKALGTVGTTLSNRFLAKTGV